MNDSLVGGGCQIAFSNSKNYWKVRDFQLIEFQQAAMIDNLKPLGWWVYDCVEYDRVSIIQ